MMDVALGVLLRRDRILVQKRREDGPLNGLWEFPGGKVEKGETALQALIREVAEETGILLHAAECKPFHVEEFCYADRRVRLHFFLCVLKEGDLTGGTWMRLNELGGAGFPQANSGAVRELVRQFGGSKGEE